MSDRIFAHDLLLQPKKKKKKKNFFFLKGKHQNLSLSESNMGEGSKILIRTE